MDLKINITTSDSCKVIVQDNSTFLPEEPFQKSQTITIDVLELNKSTGSEYYTPVYTLGKESNSAEIPVSFDGWFTVNHVVLPSKEWVEAEEAIAEGSLLTMYDTVYYSDGHSVYKRLKEGTKKEVTIEEIVEINTNGTTISRTEKDYVSICFLRKCYINLCQQIFNDRGFSSCWNKNNIDSELVYKRDLAWMAINVIKYLTECEQLAEVERIIENLHGCNGLCNSSNITSTTNGCGCSK